MFDIALFMIVHRNISISICEKDSAMTEAIITLGEIRVLEEGFAIQYYSQLNAFAKAVRSIFEGERLERLKRSSTAKHGYSARTCSEARDRSPESRWISIAPVSTNEILRRAKEQLRRTVEQSKAYPETLYSLVARKFEARYVVQIGGTREKTSTLFALATGREA